MSDKQESIKEEVKAMPEPEIKKDSKDDKPKSKKDTAVPKEFESLVDQLDKMTALQVSKFVKFLEEHWGGSAAAPAMAVAPRAGSGDGAQPAVEEKSQISFPEGRSSCP